MQNSDRRTRVVIHEDMPNPYETSTVESPTTSWNGITRLQYVMFFGAIAIVMFGAVQLVNPGLQSVSPALQGWADRIYFGSVALVPTIAIVLSIAAFRPPVSHWPVVELSSAAAICLAAMSDLLDGPVLRRVPLIYAGILVVATIILATSIQTTVCAVRSRHLWKTLAGIPVVLITSLIFLLATAIYLLRFD